MKTSRRLSLFFLCGTFALLFSTLQHFSPAIAEQCKEQKQCYEVCEKYEKQSIASCQKLCDSFECRNKHSGVTVNKSDSTDEWTITDGNSSPATGKDSWTIPDKVEYSKNDPSQCIMIKSKECSTGCTQEKGARANLCRRDCLLRYCPKANAFDVASEARVPGTLSCKLCKDAMQIQCSTQCAGGQILIGPGTYPTDLNFGCQKLCALSYCAEECPLSISSL